MANSLGTMPISVDQDITSFGATQTLQNTPFGLRVWKIALYSVGVSVAGTVRVLAIDNTELIAPMVVTAGSAAGTVLYYDNPTQLLNWKDFKVSGLTATGTRLMIWYRV